MWHFVIIRDRSFFNEEGGLVGFEGGGIMQKIKYGFKGGVRQKNMVSKGGGGSLIIIILLSAAIRASKIVKNSCQNAQNTHLLHCSLQSIARIA